MAPALPWDLEQAQESTEHDALIDRKKLLLDEDDHILSEPEGDDYCQDAITYKVEWLKGWGVFSKNSRSIWVKPKLWIMLMKLFLVALCVAVVSFIIVRDPKNIQPQLFHDITSVLNIFVSLMLGFFLSSAVGRWLTTITGYMNLFNAVRNLEMQLNTLGAPQERLDMCMRYGVLSTYFLSSEFRHLMLKPHEREEQTQATWDSLENSDDEFLTVSTEERAIMANVRDVPGQMWLWVGSLVGRMAEDGEIPSMASPTYGRIMNLAQCAQEAIRDARMSIIVRTPYVYVNTLAVLVHITNLMFAVSLGLTLGLSIGSIIYYARKYTYPLAGYDVAQLVAPASNSAISIQSIIIETLRCSFAAVLYQAFFELGLIISTPFTSSEARIPVNRMMKNLLRDLEDARRLASKVPWERPMFKRTGR